MGRRKEKEEKQLAITLKTYTPDELKKFSELCERYREEKILHTAEGDEVLRIINWNKVAVAFGAMVEKTHLGHPYYAVIIDPVEGDLRYKEFDNIVDQFQKWKGKTDYAERKKNERFEELAQQMQVGGDIIL